MGADKGKSTAVAGAFSLRDTDVDALQFFFATFMPFGNALFGLRTGCTIGTTTP